MLPGAHPPPPVVELDPLRSLIYAIHRRNTLSWSMMYARDESADAVLQRLWNADGVSPYDMLDLLTSIDRKWKALSDFVYDNDILADFYGHRHMSGDELVAVVREHAPCPT